MPELALELPCPKPDARSVEAVVRRAAAELDARGVNWRRIATAHGLDLDGEPTEGKRISTERENAFLAEAARAAGDPLFTWRLGEVDIRSYGLPVYACLNAPTVGEALDVAALLIPTLCEAVSLRTMVEGDTATLVYTSAASLKNSPFSLRSTLAFLEQLVGPELAPTRCGIAITDRQYLQAVSKQISAPVTADLPFTFISFPARHLRARVVGADERLAETLRPYWQRMANNRRGPAATRSRLAGAVIQNLHHGAPTLDLLARTLGIGRARLEADLETIGGLQPLIDEVRRQLASELLRRPGLAVERVAELLGFAKPAGFAHAHRRWTGFTPDLAP